MIKSRIVAAVSLFFMAPFAVAAVPATVVPVCSITAVPAAVSYGQSAVLKWDSSAGAVFASIDNGIGNVAPDGQLIVSPHYTTTYTLHTWNAQGAGNYCAVTLTVDGNGVISIPGVQQPTVTLQQVALYPAGTHVSLSSVPYTGAESVLYALFVLTLTLTGWYALSHRRAVFTQ